MINNLQQKALWVRQQLWEMTMRAGRGHLPSCYSCVDILVALYYGGIVRINPRNSKDPDRDIVIMSKGHAAAAFYPILADLGFFDLALLEAHGNPGSLLGMYANPNIPGIEAISDSLGHGLGIGSGHALAAKIDDRPTRVFVILGDAECHEGSIWEAAMLAGHLVLDNLCVIIDENHLGILGPPIGLEQMQARWEAFNWICTDPIDGHSFPELIKSLQAVGHVPRPLAIRANTVKGKGISFMEDNAQWHNKIPDETLQAIGRRELSIDA